MKDGRFQIAVHAAIVVDHREAFLGQVRKRNRSSESDHIRAFSEFQLCCANATFPGS